MSTQMIVAQCAMAVVLILMISGKTPLYLTAILGSALVALIAGFPLSGSEPVTVAKLVSSGLIGVIADMTGVLMFIGILQASGFLGAIVRSVIRFGTRFGGAPGVIASGAVSAGIIGMLTGYAPPIVTGAIACPAAVKWVWILIELPVRKAMQVFSGTSEVLHTQRKLPSSVLQELVSA